MNNNLNPQQDPFLPEGGWHFYTYDGITMVPKEQVEEVLNKMLNSIKGNYE